MKKLLSLLFIILYSGFLYAQKGKINRAYAADHRPALFINNKKVDALSLFLINRSDFESVVVLSPSQSFERYAESGKYGAVQITLVKDRKLYSWPQICKIFGLKPEANSLRCMMQTEEFGYKSLPVANAKSIVSSAYRVNRVSVKKSVQSGIQMLYIEPGNDYRAPVVHTPFDKQIDSIIMVFKFEAAQRGSESAY